MAKKGKQQTSPQVRLSQQYFVVMIIGLFAVALAAMIYFGGGGGTGFAVAPTGDQDSDGLNDSEREAQGAEVPALEKTNVYLHAYDNADYEDDNQKNRPNATADIIKSGEVIEQVNLTESSGAKSDAEFNGGDRITILADAPGYYAKAKENVEITETLQPIAVYIQAAATPDTYIEDSSEDTVIEMTLGKNEVSKTHRVMVERPGDDNAYQLCGIAADYNDDALDVRVKELSGDDEGSYTTGVDNVNDYDKLDSASMERVWDFGNAYIENFDEQPIEFVVGTADDVDPSAEAIDFQIFDCEANLQNGEIVETQESANDKDVGLADITETITVQ